MKKSKILVAVAIFGLFGLTNVSRTDNQIITINIPAQSAFLTMMITAIHVAKTSPSIFVRCISIGAATYGCLEYLSRK